MIEGPIKPASSSTPGAVPTPATVATKLDTTTREIEDGELIVNQVDGRVFVKTSPDGNIVDTSQRGIYKNSANSYISAVNSPISLTTIAHDSATAYTYAIPFSPRFGFTSGKMAIGISGAAGAGAVLDLALFDADPNNNFLIKNAPLDFVNNVDCSASGIKIATLSTTYSFSPNKLYYLCCRVPATDGAPHLTTYAYPNTAGYPVSMNPLSSLQAAYFRWDATGLVGGGTAAAPGTTGNWFNVSLWTHMSVHSTTPGTAPAVCMQI